MKKKIFKKSLEFSRLGGGGSAKSKKIPDFFFNFSICVLIHPEMQRIFFLFLGGGYLLRHYIVLSLIFLEGFPKNI